VVDTMCLLPERFEDREIMAQSAKMAEASTGFYTLNVS